MTATSTGTRPRHRAPRPDERLRVLLVEDDEADAFLVRELLAEAGQPIELHVAGSLADARAKLAGVDCALLDLNLPDGSGLAALRRFLQFRSGVAVCVLTGLEDEHLGVEAVAEGAQDYLVKGQVDGVGLTRALRYAVERRRADENARRLREVELRQAESARLERGLLPQPLMTTRDVSLASFYRPGRHRALLGGDFYDAVQTGPDQLHLLVGDVCGHDVDEAALGVELRVAWRALVLAGVPEQRVLPAVEQVLVSERHSDEVFATVVAASVDLSTGQARIRLAGHPPPLLISNGRVSVCEARPGMVLGVVPGLDWPAFPVPLDGDWSLLMYTDGLIEGRTDGVQRLDVSGLVRLVEEFDPSRTPLGELPGYLISRAETLNDGPLSDDVAMLLLTSGDLR
ncbi:MAG TPA: fused response regulator/phosphatase [Micromonosporaceae bacterium]